MSDQTPNFEEFYGYKFEELSVGQSAVYARTVTEADILMFAGVSGDYNPVHINEELAASTMFGGRIAHGMLSAGFISTVLGTKLPGPGAIYLALSLKFNKPSNSNSCPMGSRRGTCAVLLGRAGSSSTRHWRCKRPIMRRAASLSATSPWPSI